MTRWFYTDPLAAAWMARHFGMRFLDLASGQHLRVFKEVQFFIQDEQNPRRYVRLRPGRIYVHPVSLSLLEPRIDDVVEMRRNGRLFAVRIVRGTGSFTCKTAIRHIRLLSDTIIHRDGKAFHWPDREAA